MATRPSRSVAAIHLTTRTRSSQVLRVVGVSIAAIALIAAAAAFRSSDNSSSVANSDAISAPATSVAVTQIDTANSQPSAVSATASDPRIVKLAELQAAVKASPTDGVAWQTLASAYLRMAFETADPSYYSLARSALDRSEAILGQTVDQRVLRANLLLALHDFPSAKAEATAALAADSSKFDAQIALTDATIETGDYESARDLVQAIVDMRPGVASFSRLSYYRQLTGDIVGAEAAMRSAVSAAPVASVDRGVALAYLGEIQLERGALAPAERSFDEALRLNPASSVAAIGKAQVQAARQDWESATQTLDELTERTPTPGAFGLRADIARATGDAAGAIAADQLVDASISLLRSNGAVVDADLAMLLADRGPASATAALAAATQAYNDRKTMFTNDAMAWALVQAGRHAEALPYTEAALATNPQVAMIHWHAAVVYDAVANTDRAKAELMAAMANTAFSPSQTKAMQAMAQRFGINP